MDNAMKNTMERKLRIVTAELVQLLDGCDWGPLKRVSAYWTAAVDQNVTQAKQLLTRFECEENAGKLQKDRASS
jgi:hypothetical protein